MDVQQAVFHLRIQGCTAQQEIFDVASERFLQRLLHFVADSASDDRRLPERPHDARRDTRRDVLLVDLLYHQRNHHHLVRLHFLQRLQEYRRSRGLHQEIDMTTRAERVEELAHLPEHMRHGQDRHHRAVLGCGQEIHAGLYVVRQRTCIQHHTLRTARAARRVVDQAQCVRLGIETDVLRLDALRGILLLKLLVPSSYGSLCVRFTAQQTEVL